MKKLIFVILLCFLFAIPIYGEETCTDQIYDSIKDEFDAFESTLPDYIKDFLPDKSLEGDFSGLLNGETDQYSFLDLATNYLLSSLPQVVSTLSSFLALLIIISIFNIIKASFASEGLKNAFSMCSSICVAISAFSVISTLCDMCVEYLNTLCSTMNSFAPVMSALYIMNGSITSAAVSNASMMLFLSVIEGFIVVAISPIIKICFCFSVVSSISTSIDLSGISRTIKNTFNGACVFLISIFSFVMSFQSVLSHSADSLSLRTARFAIGNFIPVVGGFVSDSLKTISASLDLIKSSCGVVAIITIALLILPMIISAFLYKLCFDIISGISRALGCDSEARACEESSTLCGFIIAITSLSSIVFVFALTIFIKSSMGGA